MLRGPDGEGDPTGRRELAVVLATQCRRVREAALRRMVPGSRTWALAQEWAIEDERRADALAQTIACALLMGRVAAPGGSLERVLAALPELRDELPLAELERTIAEVDSRMLRGDPSLRFFEELLAAYDPAGREAAGAYYTPAEVVQLQVILVEALLGELGLGFADPQVSTIDPACGTGVYGYAIAVRTLERVRALGGNVAEAATRLAGNLVAHETMAGPFAVAHARLTALLVDAGGSLPAEGAKVRLQDTLASGDEEGSEGVVVCIGNPPYRRGGGGADIAEFLPEGGGQHAKNLYNDYVYFWRWALRRIAGGQRGIACFVTASSFLRGPGFGTMRRRMREVASELWIVDVGGDALGPRRSANVFSITTPVCIAVALRRGAVDRERPATVWYCRLAEELDRAQKLERLGAARGFADFAWQRGPDGWDAPLVAEAAGSHDDWPRLADLLPWQHSGAQWKRTWPVGETREVLVERWRALLAADDRRAAFHESEAWTVARAGADLFDNSPLVPIESLARDAPAPAIVRYGWRALDRQWCLADARLGDRLRPVLWRIHGERQIYATTLMSSGLARGPALIASAHVPDLHHFRGSFGDRGVIPLWRDAAASEPNVTLGLLCLLERELGVAVTAEALFSYIYGCLAHPGYTAMLSAALAEPGPRVPLTASPRLFARMSALGRALLHVHTFGERGGEVVRGAAGCTAAVPGDMYPETFAYADGVLRVGAGAFAPVAREVWDYEVSGLRVVRSWLGYRMRRPRGRKSSPLDAVRPASWTEAMTAELLEVLWALERSLVIHGEQATVLAEIVAGPSISREVIPRPEPAQRRPPAGGAGGRRPSR